MKALSLWQPWATLMAYDLKKVETRSWETKYRGLIIIHAAKKIVKPTDGDISTQPWIREALHYLGLKWEELPTGILAIREIVDCIKIFDSEPPGPGIAHGRWERFFGDYRHGRYAWLTKDIKRFKKPIPFNGKQGLFNIPNEALRVCRVCGCSEFNACGEGCTWVEEDMCSACV